MKYPPLFSPQPSEQTEVDDSIQEMKRFIDNPRIVCRGRSVKIQQPPTTNTRANACVPYCSKTSSPWRKRGNIDLWLLRAALSQGGRKCIAFQESVPPHYIIIAEHTHRVSCAHPSPRHRATVDQKMCDLVRAAPSILLQIKSWERERAFCLLFISPRAVCMPSVEIKKSGINRSERASEAAGKVHG